MRWPVKDKMNSTKTPYIVSGENVDTIIGHYQGEVNTDFLGHSTCVFFIFGGNEAVTCNTWAA